MYCRTHRGTEAPAVKYCGHITCTSQNREEQENGKLCCRDRIALCRRDVHDRDMQLSCCVFVHAFKTRAILLYQSEAVSLPLHKRTVVSTLHMRNAHVTTVQLRRISPRAHSFTAQISSRDRRVMRGTATSTRCEARTAGTSARGTAMQFQCGFRASMLAIQGLKSSPQNRIVGR